MTIIAFILAVKSCHIIRITILRDNHNHFRPWDAQFYPNLLKEGGAMLQIDINPDGGMTLNQDFLIDFGKVNPSAEVYNQYLVE